jgi:hypothetical protein
MGPRLRKLVLTAHVATSVGWLGAAAVFLVLGIVGLCSGDAAVVRAVYLAMDAASWPVLVPLALASLLTGLVQGLGTKWGLFRHYWVVVKLTMTVLAAAVVLLYTETLAYQADLARRVGDGDISALRSAGPVLHSGIGMVLLGTAVVLSVFKPPGLTSYGRRKRRSPATA